MFFYKNKLRSNKILRFLDLYLGIPILFFLGFFRKKTKEITFPISSIGILKPVALGDLTLLSAIIQDIKISHPNIKIVLFSGMDNHILSTFIPGVDKNVILDLRNPIKAISSVRKNPTDILIDFCSWPRINAIICFFSKAKCTLGFRTKGQHRHYAYHQSIIHKDNIHELENYRNLIKVLNIHPTHFPKISISNYLNIKNPYCIFHLSSSGFNRDYKHWSFDSWKKVYEYISKQQRLDLYLTGSEKDFFDNEAFIKSCNSCDSKIINFSKDKSFDEVLKLIKGAKFLISVNTGIMHIAAALDIPVIGLSGPTNIIRWGALGENSHNLFADSKECGYLNLGFEYKNQKKDCMSLISHTDVIKKIEKVIEK